MEKSTVDVALLFSPAELGGHWQLFEFLLIKKEKDKKEYLRAPIEGKSVGFQLIKHGAELKERFAELSATNTKTIKARLYASLSSNSNETTNDQLVHDALMKHLQLQFQQLKPFTYLNKCYHRKKKPGGDYLTTPCVFSKFKPQLQFVVVKEGNRLCLQTWIKTGDYASLLQQFTKHQFLLECNNEYFILAYKDYKTLQWLENCEVEDYGSNSTEFSKHILSRLEADYPVDRNNLFTVKEIIVEPSNRLLVSELNNAFLMLTPQWIYDGFLIENPYKPVFNARVDGEELAIVRNQIVENQFVAQLEQLHINFSKQKNGYYYLSFAEAQKKQWFLKAYHFLLEQGVEMVGMDMLSHFRYSAHKVATTSKIVNEANGKIVLELRVSFGNEQIKLFELQKMLHAGQKAVLLKDGSLGILNDEWLQQFATIIKHGRVSNSTVEVSRAMAINDRSYGEQVLHTVLKTGWWAKWQKWQNSAEPVFALPATIEATLRPYQQKGFDWLALLAEAGAGGCLADDMGLGKTLQTICFIAHFQQQQPGSVNLIICPSSLLYNWEKEWRKFARSITTEVYYGAGRNYKALIKNKPQVIITSYGTLRSDIGLLATEQFGIIVLDESHNIKNPAAQVTGAVNSLQAVARIALSGTPVINNTFDLFAQLNFALPGIFGSREFFKREYADAIDRYQDEEKMAALQKITAPFILRRTKEQVATDLPQKTESVLWCTMKSEQQTLYNNVKDQIRGAIVTGIKNEGLNKSKLAVLQGLMKLKQICNSPLLLPISEQNDCSQSIKTEVLFNELTQVLQHHKALVFSQFSSMLNLLADQCRQRGIAYFHFDGSTPAPKRAEMIDAFQQGRGPNLFLISLKAGNAGITLTAADYVFLFDPWWNTAVEQQAIDRTHRIGQTKNVFAYKLICKGTIEEKIIDLQQRKKKVADELVVSDEGFLQSLNEEEIMYLFS